MFSFGETKKKYSSRNDSVATLQMSVKKMRLFTRRKYIIPKKIWFTRKKLELSIVNQNKILSLQGNKEEERLSLNPERDFFLFFHGVAAFS